MNYALCANCVISQRGKQIFFFLHFNAFQSISSRLRHTFFSKMLVSVKRKLREQSEQDAIAKSEGAKRPSSPAGLAGRSV